MESKNISAWDRVLLARHSKRPTSKTLIDYIFPDFLEIHGDRLFADDESFICGITTLSDFPITIIAQEKGRTIEEKIKKNFGMPHPEGYRKAIRLVKQAEKFERPICFIIDTPGAYPGIQAEERGQATAIAQNLTELITVEVPMISVVLSEGGSGGALAIGVSDQVWMFENAVYSILSPEGFASILYKDSSKTSEAAEVMKLTADDLYEFKIIDKIIKEPNGGLHNNYQEIFNDFKKSLEKAFKDLKKVPIHELLEKRYKRYRLIGQFQDI